MKIIRRGKVQKFAFDNRDKPCLRVKQGEVFQVETDDALSGLIADDSDNPLVHPMIGEHVAKLQQSYPPLYNPVVGPIFVDGCEDGDVLALFRRFDTNGAVLLAAGAREVSIATIAMSTRIAVGIAVLTSAASSSCQ